MIGGSRRGLLKITNVHVNASDQFTILYRESRVSEKHGDPGVSFLSVGIFFLFSFSIRFSRSDAISSVLIRTTGFHARTPLSREKLNHFRDATYVGKKKNRHFCR
jgi:hypothetical protein